MGTIAIIGIIILASMFCKNNNITTILMIIYLCSLGLLFNLFTNSLKLLSLETLLGNLIAALLFCLIFGVPLFLITLVKQWEEK